MRKGENSGEKKTWGDKVNIFTLWVFLLSLFFVSTNLLELGGEKERPQNFLDIFGSFRIQVKKLLAFAFEKNSNLRIAKCHLRLNARNIHKA